MSAIDDIETFATKLEVWGQNPKRRLLRLCMYARNENNDLREALEVAVNRIRELEERSRAKSGSPLGEGF